MFLSDKVLTEEEVQEIAETVKNMSDADVYRFMLKNAGISKGDNHIQNLLKVYFLTQDRFKEAFKNLCEQDKDYSDNIKIE